MDLLKLDMILTSCNVVRRHLARFPYEPITFDRVELSHFKSSLKACRGAAEVIRENIYFLERDIADAIRMYLDFCIAVDDQDYFARRDIMGKNREVVGVLSQVASYRAVGGWHNEPFKLTEENIDILGDVERLIAAPLDRRQSMILRFKLRWAGVNVR